MRNLEGKIPEDSRMYLSREDALDQLRRVSGEDFGSDVAAWQDWVSSNKEKFCGFDLSRE